MNKSSWLIFGSPCTVSVHHLLGDIEATLGEVRDQPEPHY